MELGEARFITGFTGSYDSVMSVADLGFGRHAAYLKAFKGKLAACGGLHPSGGGGGYAQPGPAVPLLTFTETYRDHYDDFVSTQPPSG